MPDQQRSPVQDAFVQYQPDAARRPFQLNGGGRGNAAAQDALRGRTGQAGGDKAAADKGIDWELVESIADQLVAMVPREMRDGSREHILAILRQAALKGVRNSNQVAYLLATAEHESRFGHPQFSWGEPLVEEGNPIRKRRNGRWSGKVHIKNRWVSGKTKDEAEQKYWDALYGGKLGNKRGTSDAADYRGRGYVQITGKANYRKMSKVLAKEGFTYEHDGVKYGGRDGEPIDLVAHPEHVNEVPDLAARILVDGAMDGLFRNRSLDRYVNLDDDEDTFATKNNFYDARRVINADTKKNGRKIADAARRYAQTLLLQWPMIFPEAAARTISTGRVGGR